MAGPLLILTALRVEMRAIRRAVAMRDSAAVAGDLSASVIGHVGGMGAGIVGGATPQLVARWNPRALVLAGFAGALAPCWGVGNVVEPIRVVGADHRGWGLSATGRLTEIAAAPVPVATDPRVLLTVSQVVDSPAAKRRWAERSGAGLVDLESLHVAAFAAERGLPLRIVRAVSDHADEALPAWTETLVDADGGTRWWAAARLVAADLRRIGTLLRLGRGCRRAGNALGVAVAQVVREWKANQWSAA